MGFASSSCIFIADAQNFFPSSFPSHHRLYRPSLVCPSYSLVCPRYSFVISFPPSSFPRRREPIRTSPHPPVLADGHIWFPAFAGMTCVSWAAQSIPPPSWRESLSLLLIPHFRGRRGTLEDRIAFNESSLPAPRARSLDRNPPGVFILKTGISQFSVTASGAGAVVPPGPGRHARTGRVRYSLHAPSPFALK